jgi:hypothetical protein
VTKKEYDQEYIHALEYLVRQGHRVGSPYHSCDGIRVVRIDNFPWTDDVVFEQVRGKEIAAAIRASTPNVSKAVRWASGVQSKERV